MGSRAQPGRLCRLGGPARRVHRAGAAGRAPDARCAAVPQPSVQRGQRRGHGVVLHPVRLHLPDDAVLPGRQGLRSALSRCSPAARGAVGWRWIGRGDSARRKGRDQARRHRRARRDGRVLRLGGGDHQRDDQLPHHRGPDGGVRARHGPDLRARHGVHHGRHLAAQGRRRLGRERLHQAGGRHPRRGRDRQCLRIRLRIAADRHPAGGCAGPGRGDRAPVRRRRVRGGRPDRGPRPAGPRAGTAADRRQRVPARPDHQLPRRRGGGRRGGRPGRPVPARPARPASSPGGRSRQPRPRWPAVPKPGTHCALATAARHAPQRVAAHPISTEGNQPS